MISLKTINTVERKTAIRPSKIEYVDLNANPIQGCSHACTYCFSRKIDLQYKKVKSATEWHRPKLVSNFFELLEKEIDKIDSNHEIFLSTMTDVYQPAASKISLARLIIERFQEADLKYRVLTKSPDIVQDKDLFANYKKGLIGLSITTDAINGTLKKWEPRTKPIYQRLDTLKELHEYGDINLWVSVEPILPGTRIECLLRDVFYNARESLKELVIGKMNYVAGIDKLFDWKKMIRQIEDYRNLFSKVKFHYKKETTKFLLKNYPEITPNGGYP